MIQHARYLFKTLTAISTLFLLCFSVGALAQQSRAQNTENEYTKALIAFKSSLELQIDEIFWPQVQSDSLLTENEKLQIYEINQNLKATLFALLERHKSDYSAVFFPIENNNNSELSKARFMQMESSLKSATEKLLNAMADLLDSSHQNRATRLYLKTANLLLENLKNDLEVKADPRVLLHQTITNKSKFKTLCSVIARMCFNEKMNRIIDSIPLEELLRESTEYDKQIQDQLKSISLPENSALILIVNHDSPLADLTLLNKMTRALGIQRNILLTTRFAWPQTRIFKNPDPDILFIEDKDLAKSIVENSRQSQTGHLVSTTIYPEGNVPFFSTNFPLSTKYGAFSIARKTAVQLAQEGRKVYLLKIFTNVFEETTSLNKPGLVIKVSSPELVPSNPIEKNDDWVNKQRLSFENEISQKRGRFQIDLKNRAKLENGIWANNFLTKPLANKWCKHVFN
jgi:hypothetical protein